MKATSDEPLPWFAAFFRWLNKITEKWADQPTQPDIRPGRIVECSVDERSFVACVCDVDDSNLFVTIFTTDAAGQPEATRLPIKWVKPYSKPLKVSSKVTGALGLSAEPTPASKCDDDP